MRNLSGLIRQFSRPANQHPWDRYAQQIALTDSEPQSPPDIEWLDTLAIVISALYGGDEKPVYLVSEEWNSYANLVFTIWNQQWPRLRRSFSFSTCSLSERSVNGRPLDFQIAPASMFQKLKRKQSNVLVVPPKERLAPESMPWVTLIVQDLWASSDSDLRKFLWKYGADTTENRSTFRALAGMFLGPS
jgi:hypothetical protein